MIKGQISLIVRTKRKPVEYSSILGTWTGDMNHGMAVTSVGGGRSRKVAEPPSPVPQVDGGPTSKPRPTKWGPVITGTGPSFEDWLKSKGLS